MWMVKVTRWPVFSREEPQCPRNRRLGGPQSRPKGFGEQKKKTLATTVIIYIYIYIYIYTHTHTHMQSIFILIINQLDNLMHKLCFTINFFHACTCFEHHVINVRRSKLYYTASCIITPIGVMIRCDDTRGCIIQFWPPDDEHMLLETCRGMI